MDATKAQLKSLIDKAEELRTKAEKSGAWDEATAKEYEGILGQADKLKLVIGLNEHADEIKAWSQQSAGSVVRDGWRNAGPTEGVIPGVTTQPGSDGTDLYALGTVGAAKAAILKSGAYKDAYVDYIRSMAKFGRMDAIKAESMKVLQEGVDTSGGLTLAV